MAVDPAKIRQMMSGKTLTKDNIRKMAKMVEKAEDAEAKKQVMKHSVFFVGQLPLLEGYVIDYDQTRKLLLASVPYDEIDTYMKYLFEGLTTQKLLLNPEEGVWQVNTRYENTVAKAARVAKAYQADQEESLKENLDAVKKVYQTATKYYHAGQYEEAAQYFKRACESGGYRMAYYSLATMYAEGKGLSKDWKQALYYACNALVRGARIADALIDQILKDHETA